ncbi:MAG: hypothetical protein HYW48_10215 [Deltaproteobacteria bacterium]|nr:hypothetical protein [Deltaproteobacteria bacterium]
MRSFKALMSTEQVSSASLAEQVPDGPVFFLAPGLTDLEVTIEAYKRNLRLCSSYDAREAGRFLVYALDEFEIQYKFVDTAEIIPAAEPASTEGLLLAAAPPVTQAPAPAPAPASEQEVRGAEPEPVATRRFSSPRDPRTQWVVDQLGQSARTGKPGGLQALYPGPEASVTGAEVSELLSKAKGREVKLVAVKMQIEGVDRLVFVPSRVASGFGQYVSGAGEGTAISQALLGELQGQGRASDWDLVPVLRYQTIQGGLELPFARVPSPSGGQTTRDVYAELLGKEFSSRLETALGAKNFVAIPLTIPGHEMMLIVDKQKGNIELYDPSGFYRYGTTERLGASTQHPWADAVIDEVRRVTGFEKVTNVITEDFQRVGSGTKYKSDLQCGIHSCSFMERRMRGETYESISDIARKPDIIEVRERYRTLIEEKGLTRSALEFYGLKRNAQGELTFETRADVGNFSIDFFGSETSLLGADEEGRSFEARVSAELRSVSIDDFPNRVASLYESHLKRALVSDTINDWLRFQDKVFETNLFRDYDRHPSLAGLSREDVIYSALRQENFQVPRHMKDRLSPEETGRLQDALTQIKTTLESGNIEKLDAEIGDLLDKYERGVDPDSKPLAAVDEPDLVAKTGQIEAELKGVDTQIQAIRNMLGLPDEKGMRFVEERARVATTVPESAAGPADEFFRTARQGLTVASVTTDKLPTVSELPSPKKGRFSRFIDRLRKPGSKLSASQKRGLELDLERAQTAKSGLEAERGRLDGMARSQRIREQYESRIEEVRTKRQALFESFQEQLGSTFKLRQSLEETVSLRLWEQAKAAEVISRNWDLVKEAMVKKTSIDAVLSEKLIPLDAPDSVVLRNTFETRRADVEAIHTEVEGHRANAESYMDLLKRQRAGAVTERPDYLDDFKRPIPSDMPETDMREKTKGPTEMEAEGGGRWKGVVVGGIGILAVLGVSAVIASQAQLAVEEDQGVVTCFEFNKKKLWFEIEQLAQREHEAYVLGFALWNRLQSQ